MSFTSGVSEETQKAADPHISVVTNRPEVVELIKNPAIEADVSHTPATPLQTIPQSTQASDIPRNEVSESVHHSVGGTDLAQNEKILSSEHHEHDEARAGEHHFDDEHHVADEHWVTDENGVANEHLDHHDEWAAEETPAEEVEVGHVGTQHENDLWHALQNLKKLHNQKIEEHSEDLHELYELRHQLTYVREEYIKLERRLMSQTTSNEETVAASTVALLHAKERLATCEKELSNTHAYTGQVVQDLKQEMNMKMKESVVRIKELEKESGFCSIVPPEKFSAANYEKADEKGQDDRDHFADEAHSPTNFLSSFGSKIVAIFGGIFGSINSVVISPLSSNAAAISSSAYNVAHPLASGVSRHAGHHWNNVVMPPYRAHVEPHVSKVTGSMQVTYDSYLKDTVDANHAYFWGTFVGTALTAVYVFFVSENLLIRIIGLPLTILISLLGSFMAVVSYAQKIPGMQAIFGSYSRNAAIVMVSVTGLTTTILLHKYVVDLRKLFLYSVTSPYTFLKWLFTRMPKGIKRMFGMSGSKTLDSKKSDIYGSSSNGYSDTDVNYGTLPSTQYGNSGHWNNDHTISHTPSADPRYSAMSVPSIRSSMISSDLRSRDDKPNNNYYGSSISHSHSHSDNKRYSPPTAPGIRSSMSVDQRNRDEQPNRYYGSDMSNTGSENSRHSISLTSADLRPMMSSDQWSREGQSNKFYDNNHAPGVPPRMGTDYKGHNEPPKPYFKNDTIDITDRRFSYRDNNQSVTDDDNA